MMPKVLVKKEGEGILLFIAQICNRYALRYVSTTSMKILPLRIVKN